METSERRRTFVVQVVLVPLLLLSPSVLRGADAVAMKTTLFYDDACKEDVGVSVLNFGTTTGPTELSDYNECVTFLDHFSFTSVCDATTGEVGLNTFSDEACTDLDSKGATAPSCILSNAECTGNTACAITFECTDDDEISTISPNTVNFFAEEYHDADCHDPTGNTVVLAGSTDIGHIYDGGCTQIGEGMEYALSECRSDGSFLGQLFSPEDETCSGEVWGQTVSPTEYSPTLCSTASSAEGLYYAYISCTTDAASVFLDSSPATNPTTGRLAPIPDLDHDPTTDTLVATANVGDETTFDTPAPMLNRDADNVLYSSPAPMASTNDGSEASAPPPVADGSGSSATANATPSDMSGANGDEKGRINEAGVTNGAIGTGRRVAIGTIALSCAMGLLVSVAM